MAAPTAGSIVLIQFPFSDLSRAKLRPAVVLASVGRDDFVLCQVTSNPYSDPLAVELTDGSFADGSLQRTSYARPGKLFTAHVSLFQGQPGILTADSHRHIIDCVVDILRQANTDADEGAAG